MMNVETVAHTIQLILAPVVMVTACGLMLNSLVVRYGAIAEHVRALSHERLDVLRRMSESTLDRERLAEIDAQVPELLRRHKHLHDALLLVYAAVLAFIGNMVVIAIASATHSDVLANIVLGVFLIGVALLFVAVIFVMVEVRNSHHISNFEAQRVASL
jgi:hypothetical protein